MPTDIRLDVVSARESTLRPARGDDPCAPYRGMKLLTPFAELGAPAGCALSRNDAGAHVMLGSTTVTDTHILSTDMGATVSGTGIPAGATVASALPGVSFELSAAGTANFTGSIHLARLQLIRSFLVRCHHNAEVIRAAHAKIVCCFIDCSFVP